MHKNILLFSLVHIFMLNLCGSVVPFLAINNKEQVKSLMGKREVGKNILTHEDRMEFLKAHNNWRSNVNPPASDMKRMYWSSEIERAAQTWSNRCVWGHGDPDLSKNKYQTLGQNIYGGGYNITKLVKMWGDEVNAYDFGSNGCTNVCGHYTQIVWSKSYILGCGITDCPNMGYYYVVCDYYPPGNWLGQKPYKSGSPCSECEKGLTCSDNLCGEIKCADIENECAVVDQERCICGASEYKGEVNSYKLNHFIVAFCLFLNIKI